MNIGALGRTRTGFNQAQKIQAQAIPRRGLRWVLAGLFPSLETVGTVILV